MSWSTIICFYLGIHEEVEFLGITMSKCSSFQDNAEQFPEESLWIHNDTSSDSNLVDPHSSKIAIISLLLSNHCFHKHAFHKKTTI